MIAHSQDVEKAQALYRPDAGTSDGHSANDLLNMPSGCQSRQPAFVSSPQRYGKTDCPPRNAWRNSAN
ncbi:MAG: hypothetical protein ACLR78_02200 [Roseburia sp.]